MSEQTLTKNAEILQKYGYGYGQIDASGNLDATKNNGQLAQVESYIGTNKQWTQKFSYDSIGRLDKSEEYRGDNGTLSYHQKFDYDKFGNLYRKTANNSTAGQQNPLPYTAIEDADISKTTNRFTSGTLYDDAGNVTQDTKFRGYNYKYDANGRMYQTIQISNGNQSDAVYDASGQRVATLLYGVWTFFIYDIGGKKVAEYGGTQSGNGVNYVLSDWQGSTRAIVGTDGAVKARTDYTAFGEEINSGIGQRTTAQGFGATNNLSQKYALTERDKATGLDHTWFRKLENFAGRWTSPDPYNGSMSIGDPQSFNRYSYVNNQPTNYVDPSGLLLSPGCYVYVAGTISTDGTITISSYFSFCVSEPGGGGGGGGRRGRTGGGGGRSGSSNSTNKPTPRINKDVLNNCVEELFGKNAAQMLNFKEATNGNNGYISTSLPTFSLFSGLFDIDVTTYDSVEFSVEYRNAKEQEQRGRSTSQYQNAIFTIPGFTFGVASYFDGNQHTDGVIYLPSDYGSSALALTQVNLINQILIKTTGQNNSGLLECVTKNDGVNLSED